MNNADKNSVWTGAGGNASLFGAPHVVDVPGGSAQADADFDRLKLLVENADDVRAFRIAFLNMQFFCRHCLAQAVADSLRTDNADDDGARIGVGNDASLFGVPYVVGVPGGSAQVDADVGRVKLRTGNADDDGAWIGAFPRLESGDLALSGNSQRNPFMRFMKLEFDMRLMLYEFVLRIYSLVIIPSSYRADALSDLRQSFNAKSFDSAMVDIWEYTLGAIDYRDTEFQEFSSRIGFYLKRFFIKSRSRSRCSNQQV